PTDRLAQPEALAAYYEQLLSRLGAVSGVEAAGAILNLPFAGNNRNGDFLLEGRPKPGPSERYLTEMQVVAPGYFETMRIPLVAGRLPGAQDRAGGQPIAVVNQA